MNDKRKMREGYLRRERREKSHFLGLLLVNVGVCVTVRVDFGADIVIDVGDLLIGFGDWWMDGIEVRGNKLKDMRGRVRG